MSIDHIINSIRNNKKIHHLDFSLKAKTEVFTDDLFYTLFDSNISMKENIDYLSNSFQEITSIACKMKNLEAVQAMVTNGGFSVNDSDGLGVSVLASACENDCAPLARWLVSAGADVDDASHGLNKFDIGEGHKLLTSVVQELFQVSTRRDLG